MLLEMVYHDQLTPMDTSVLLNGYKKMQKKSSPTKWTASRLYKKKQLNKKILSHLG